ncbi:MAG: hypothetical protein D6800_11880 [Candidatus Zixiibacteriota bacterium]|nr:MAG: hypothetical protein D6800_11880 [candidate division Zixibacteria bacterium]
MRKSYFRNPGNDNFREEEIIRRVVVNASGGSVDVYDEDNPASPVVSLGVGESASMTYDVAGVLMATVGGSGGGGGVVETTTYATALPGSVGPEGSQVYITGGDLDGAVYEVVGGTWQFATNYRYSARTSHPNLANVPVGFRWMLANGASSDGLYESDGSSAFQLAGFAGGGSGSGLAKLDPSWTVVNPPGTPDRTLDDGSTTTLQDINRVLGTLILDLKTILG